LLVKVLIECRLELDNIELNRLVKVRGKLIEQCLENFMLALSASDEHDNDALRFFAVWLENAESDLANAAVSRHIDKIASHKFVRLMNQLSSRMQADNSLFQKLLLNLVLRICKEHPFHGMHHITAGVHTPGTNQVASKLRHQAAKQIASQLKTDKVLGNLWYCVYQSDRL
jgi:ataxia telangiectasia mutated family protein